MAERTLTVLSAPLPFSGQWCAMAFCGNSLKSVEWRDTRADAIANLIEMCVETGATDIVFGDEDFPDKITRQRILAQALPPKVNP